MGQLAKRVEASCLSAGMAGPSGILKAKAVGSALELWLRSSTVSCIAVGVLGVGTGNLSLLGNGSAVGSFGLKREWVNGLVAGVFGAPYVVTGPCGVGVGSCQITGFVGDVGTLEGLIRSQYAGFGMTGGDEVTQVSQALYSGFITSTGAGVVAGAPIIPPGVSGALPFIGTIIF